MRALVVVLLLPASLLAGEASQPDEAKFGHRGYRLLVDKAYLPPDFDQETFDEIWKTWEEPLRSQAESATPAERRRMAFSRYGLTEAPGRAGPLPLQYTPDGAGGWAMNCFACHGGKVAGRVIPGLPNSHLALETLTHEVSLTKVRQGKPLDRMDLGLLVMPLGGSNGTTNAAMFGVVLLAQREADLTVNRDLPRPEMLHHDLDAPPLWNVKHKQYLYCDGFAPKSHRALMQFLLVPENGPQQFAAWEDDYRAVLDWIESLEPPKYPFEVDRQLAKRGEAVFNDHCARCHGTYGRAGKYPEKVVPIDVVNTDRARLDSLNNGRRAHYAATWFADGEITAIEEPQGYVAPPLHGVWATAPYFHNGSVPTLAHVLDSASRPKVWKRTEDGYDRQRVGLEIDTFDGVPESALSYAERRRYFDTSRFSKSAAGHTFPDALDETEKRAVLEYLKTL